jgi:hypothetical protein
VDDIEKYSGNRMSIANVNSPQSLIVANILIEHTQL